MIVLTNNICKQISGADATVHIHKTGDLKWLDIDLFSGDKFVYDDGHYAFTLCEHGITHLRGPGANNISPGDVFAGSWIEFGGLRIGGTNDKAAHFQIMGFK